MSGKNIIDFNEALKRAEQEEQTQHEHKCPHCELKSEWAATLLTRLRDMPEEEIVDFVGEMFDWAFDEGCRDAFSDIIGFAGHNIDHIDGVVDDE